MKQMFLQPLIAIYSAVRLLFNSRRALGLMLAAYAGLLSAVYLFVSTREATIGQLMLTLALLVIVPALFFVLQAISVCYTDRPLSQDLLRTCLRLVFVSVPLIGATMLGVYGLSKVHAYVTITTALRYLLFGVFVPLLAIQLWVAASDGGGLRGLPSNLRRVAVRAFAPGSVLIYMCGLVIFAAIPYELIKERIPTERAWLDFSLLTLRLSLSGLLILFGWVTTVGAISIFSRGGYAGGARE